MVERLRSLEEERLLDQFDRPSYAEILAQTLVPSLLKQIVDDRLGRPGGETGGPPTVAGVRRGGETAALLTGAAVVGQEVPLAVWGTVTAKDEETLLDAAERAEAAHLVT